jgi:hypothetical protein
MFYPQYGRYGIAAHGKNQANLKASRISLHCGEMRG